jgi:hypothetical protein
MNERVIKQSNTIHKYNITYLLTELSPSREAANCAAIQEIPSNFKEPEGSSPCSQEPSTGPYPEPVRSSPYDPICLRYILILSLLLLINVFLVSPFPFYVDSPSLTPFFITMIVVNATSLRDFASLSTFI